MSADPGRTKIDARILAWMREPSWDYNEQRFEEIALELFAFQFEHCEVFRRFCEGRGQTPETVDAWRRIPAVPTGAFKEVALRSFPEKNAVHCFRTSGTATAVRGTLHLDTLELYEASLLPTFRRFMFPELILPGDRASIRVLAPSPAEQTDSSLSHMFGVALRELGELRDSGFDSHKGVLDATSLIERLLRLCDTAKSTESRRPVALCGTSFAFVHLLEAFERGIHAGTKLTLPRGSRIMETGGFKGRSREVPRDQLYAALEQRLGIPTDYIVNQYGMTELGSQFYDSLLFEFRLAKSFLSWARCSAVTFNFMRASQLPKYEAPCL